MFTAILKSLLAIISILMVFSLYEYYSGELRVMRIKRYLIRGQTGVLTSPMAILFILECLLCSIHVPPGIEAKIKFRDIWKKNWFTGERFGAKKIILWRNLCYFFNKKTAFVVSCVNGKSATSCESSNKKNEKYQLKNHCLQLPNIPNSQNGNSFLWLDFTKIGFTNKLIF